MRNTIWRHRLLSASALFALIAAAPTLGGCEDDVDGLDDVVDEAGEAIDDAADEIDDAVDDAGDSIDDAADDLFEDRRVLWDNIMETLR